LLLAEGAEEEEEVAIKANYLQSLSDACTALSALNLQNPYLDISALEKQLINERERTRTYPGRLIPIALEVNEDDKARGELDP